MGNQIVGGALPSANLSLILQQAPADPVSGSSPLRASLCQIERIDAQDAREERATGHDPSADA